MKPRSKKYNEKRKADDGSKKGSANKEGYDEQTQVNINEPKENPAPTKLEEEIQQEISKKESK